MMKDKELLDSLYQMDGEKLLSMNQREFDSWVMSFKDVSLSLNQIKKIKWLLSHYRELHEEHNDKVETMSKDSLLIDALGLSDKDIESNYSNIEPIISLLNEEYYASTKALEIVKHQAFPGIPDLGHPVLNSLHDEFNISNFEQLAKAIAMLHNTKIYDANEEWLVKQDKPSLDDCVCFKEDVDMLDESIINNAELKLNIGYVPHKEWMIRHTKIVVSIAKAYLDDPLKYCRTYISLNKDTLEKINLKKDLVKQLIKTKDINVETMLIVIVDALEKGYEYRDLGIGEENGK